MPEFFMFLTWKTYVSASGTVCFPCEKRMFSGRETWKMIRQMMKSVGEFLHLQTDTVFYNGLFVFRNSVGLIFLYFLNNLFRWLSQKHSTVLINYRNTF